MASLPSLKKPPASPGKNALEWTVFGLSCLLVAATLAVLIHGVAVWEDSPARLTVQTGTAYRESGLTWVPVRVTNEGDHAAKNVEIEVVSPSATGEEKASFTVDEVPHGAWREGLVSFAGENLDRVFRARVSGYQTE